MSCGLIDPTTAHYSPSLTNLFYSIRYSYSPLLASANSPKNLESYIYDSDHTEHTSNSNSNSNSGVADPLASIRAAPLSPLAALSYPVPILEGVIPSGFGKENIAENISSSSSSISGSSISGSQRADRAERARIRGTLGKRSRSSSFEESKGHVDDEFNI